MHLRAADFPPTVYVSMERDVDTKERIRLNQEELEARGVPVEVVKVGAAQFGRLRPLPPSAVATSDSSMRACCWCCHQQRG